MATIKSFTSLEQSKKLAEILPIESADMVIWGKDLDAIVATNAQKLMKGLKDRKMNYIPCWSLSALLGVLPEEVIENYYAPNLQKENGKYSIAYGNEELLCVADNPIDCCVEMIIKLNKLKML